MWWLPLTRDRENPNASTKVTSSLNWIFLEPERTFSSNLRFFDISTLWTFVDSERNVLKNSQIRTVYLLDRITSQNSFWKCMSDLV